MSDETKRIAALLAEHVMGWSVCRDPMCDGCNASACCYVIDDEGRGRWNVRRPGGPDWNPEESIADAWEVVEKMREAGRSVHIIGRTSGWAFTFGREWNRAEHKLAPAAVCLAALKAKGVEVELTEDAP